MESWEVVVVGAGPAALRAAIASADGGATTILIDSAGIGSRQGAPSLAGIAASLGEINSISHREDTIITGGDTTDNVVVARICGEAVSIVSELERWGLVFRRGEEGLPHMSKTPGHSKPRLTGCGDSTIREITRILEEQVIKRKITRKYDNLAISLVSDNKQIRGLNVLDILTGEVNSIQAKSIILATEGYEGLWSTPVEGAGTGAALAAKSDIPLVGMSNFSNHPLIIKGTNIHMPIELLSEGGRIRKANGDEAEPFDVNEETCILDLRELNNDSKIWFSNILSTIKNRTGLNIETDVIPISAGIITTGGIPIDKKGRVIFDDGKMWFTGLYAAGRSSNTGMHGEGILSGNILLEDLFTGQVAGKEASHWALDQEFANSSLILQEQNKTFNDIKNLHKDTGKSVGQICSNLMILINNLQDNNNEATINSVSKTLSEIKKNGIKLTDRSKIMNTELSTALQIKGLIVLLDQMVK